MDVNLLLGAMTVAATGFGIWGLVFRKNGNDQHPPANVTQLLQRDLWQVEKLAEVLQPLATLPNRLETTFQQHLAAAQAQEPPDWSLHLMEHLEYIQERMSEPVPPAWPPGLAASLERITDKLDAVLQVPRPVELEPLVEQIKELVDVERQRAARQTSENPKATRTGEAPAVTRPSPTLAPPSLRSSRSITRAAEPVILDEFNTIAVIADTIYELRPPGLDVFQANILHLGSGWLYVRANAEPTIGDPKATTLPPGAIDNEVRLAQRLYVLASADGSITVRLAH